MEFINSQIFGYRDYTMFTIVVPGSQGAWHMVGAQYMMGTN